MYVRKFEAYSMDEALKEIKKEMGPDAIILKTTTNKGLKGAFKKTKVEITAAISEKNYIKKSKVDAVLDEEQKDEFYSGSASFISNMIDSHESGNSEHSSYVVKSGGGYGSVGLNKSVKTVKNIGQKIKSGLDEFLSLGNEEISVVEDVMQEPVSRVDVLSENDREKKKEQEQEQRLSIPEPKPELEINSELYQEQKGRIEVMEAKLYSLAKSMEKFERKEAMGVYQLRNALKSFNICEQYISKICKKALFDLVEEDLENYSSVFEFALGDMLEAVKIGMPLFSRNDIGDKPVITVFISEGNSGQTSMVHKMAALKPDTVIIKNREKDYGVKFTENMFGMEVIHTSSIASIVSNIRKTIDAGSSVFVDYKDSNKDAEEGKKLMNSLTRSFDNIEALISLSAINTELYNKRIVNKYRSIGTGITVSGLDICLDFGSLFNIAYDNPNLPFKLFGTGETIAEDIEAATGERVLAGIFKF